jgi:hypothetical protein
MTITKNLPDYSKLFGALDFKEVDAARTVYSPAAYLADLIQLIDDTFDQADLRDRRPDIDKIPLDRDNSFSIVPYLDIVIELLERVASQKTGQRVADSLKAGTYPFNLPFNLSNEKLKKFLHFHGVSPRTLHGLFSQTENPDRVARDALGLSEEEYDVVISKDEVDEKYREKYFNEQRFTEPNKKKPLEAPISVETFLQMTGLSGSELRTLIVGNLSAAAVMSGSRYETERAAEFFINAGLKGYAKFDDQEENIVWSGSQKEFPPEWFDRVNRLVRLSIKTGIPCNDLDLVLRTCGGNEGPKLDAAAIRHIAVILGLQRRMDCEIDVVCTLFGPINTLGIGNEEAPQDLFNRIFNVPFAEVSRAVVTAQDFAGDYRPAQYANYDRQYKYV